MNQEEKDYKEIIARCKELNKSVKKLIKEVKDSKKDLNV